MSELSEDSMFDDDDSIGDSSGLMDDVLDESSVDEAVMDDDSSSEEIGQTSDESGDDGDSDDSKVKSAGKSMTIFDAMLIMSFVFVFAATLLLFFELRNFGDFPSTFPWRTSEYLNVLM